MYACTKHTCWQITFPKDYVAFLQLAPISTFAMARTNTHNWKLYNSNFIQHTSKCRTLKLGKQILKTGDTSHVLAQNSAAIVQLIDHESS